MSKKDKILNIVFWILLIFYIFLIFSNSIQPAVDSREKSGDFIKVIERFLSFFDIHIGIHQHIVRKLAHFAEYCLLGILLCIGFFRNKVKSKKTLFLTLLIGLIVPVIDECIQLFAPGRGAQVKDTLIDYSGIITGALLTFLILRKIYFRYNS